LHQRIANNLIASFDRTTFQQLFVRWIINDNLPFSITESPRLRDLLGYVQPAIKERNAHMSRCTVRNMAVKLYGYLISVSDVFKGSASPGWGILKSVFSNELIHIHLSQIVSDAYAVRHIGPTSS